MQQYNFCFTQLTSTALLIRKMSRDCPVIDSTYYITKGILAQEE
jgi:hypothetical protein